VDSYRRGLGRDPALWSRGGAGMQGLASMEQARFIGECELKIKSGIRSGACSCVSSSSAFSASWS